MTRRFLATLAGVAALLAPVATMAAEPPPVEAFFSPPSMTSLSLSPNGEYFAMTMRAPNGRRQLVVGPVADPSQINVAAAFFDADVGNVQWANDDHLVYTSSQDGESYARSHGHGLFIVRRDGSDQKPLIKVNWWRNDSESHIVRRTFDPNHRLVRVLRDGTADLILERWFVQRDSGTEPAGPAVVVRGGAVPLRLNTESVLATETVPKEVVAHAVDWLFDDKGRPRVVVKGEGDVTTVLLAPEDPSKAGDWRTISTGTRFSPSKEGTFYPKAIGPDGTVYVESFAGDTRTVHALDGEGRLIKTPIVSIKGFDFEGDLVFNRKTGKLAGVHYEGDGPGSFWLDPAIAAVQAKVDAKLPGLSNRIEPADCGCSTHYAVVSESDHQPPVYMLYDSAKDTLVQLGQERPEISARAMADTDFYRFKARDGLEIPAYVTHPAGKGPWPTVVLIHGGPWVRGAHWSWEEERQFLASRGYLVVEPEFRGSEGYGSRHFLAGIKQWGLGMQDDVADATKWATEKGWADPKRVCLMGFSYGGYSTLMGLARDGALYRCGVAGGAPTDLIGKYDMWQSDASDDWRYVGMPLMMGDKVKDAEMLREASPVFQAKRIDKPLLLAQGGLDRRVPPEHAQRMLDALKAAGRPVTFVLYADEGHGWKKPEDNYDYYRRVESFLAENLK